MSRTRRVTVWVTGPIIMNLTKALANAREAERVSGRPLPRMRLSLCPMDRETGEGRVSARTAPHRAPHSPRPGSRRQGPAQASQASFSPGPRSPTFPAGRCPSAWGLPNVAAEFLELRWNSGGIPPGQGSCVWVFHRETESLSTAQTSTGEVTRMFSEVLLAA